MVSVGDDCRCLNRTTCDARFHESSVFCSISIATSFSSFTHKSRSRSPYFHCFYFIFISFSVNNFIYLFLYTIHVIRMQNYSSNPGWVLLSYMFCEGWIHIEIILLIFWFSYSLYFTINVYLTFLLHKSITLQF